MATQNTGNTGFEKQIWDAACVLRGNLDASEYKSVVLGLIFPKYISDRFEARHDELAAEGDGFEEDKDEYTAENIFFVPEGARWNAIVRVAHTPEIGEVIDDATRAIERENRKLKDVLPKNFARPELDRRRLGEVVDLFTNVRTAEHGTSRDILGDTYQYCLRKFAEQEGKLAGEFFTPECVVKTLVEVLQPFDGRVYDIKVLDLIQNRRIILKKCCKSGTFQRFSEPIEMLRFSLCSATLAGVWHCTPSGAIVSEYSTLLLYCQNVGSWRGLSPSLINAGDIGKTANANCRTLFECSPSLLSVYS